jgi:hypothetical protein
MIADPRELRVLRRTVYSVGLYSSGDRSVNPAGVSITAGVHVVRTGFAQKVGSEA